MSTRAYIVREKKAGELEFIYNHFDGDPEYLGRILRRCYSTSEKVATLIGVGDICYIREQSAMLERMRGGESAKVIHEHKFFGMLATRTIDYVYLFRRGKWTAFDACMNEVDIP